MSGLRGQAAVVGVADAVSPTGELDVWGRALEARMVAEALEDAGLALSDVDGVCHHQSSMAFAEYLGINARYTDSTRMLPAPRCLALRFASAASIPKCARFTYDSGLTRRTAAETRASAKRLM